jgi:hypothetical protein
MRIVLIITVIVMSFSANVLAQSDFKTLDNETYDYFLKGDYKNLKKSADQLLAQGTDYYWLRMRMGIVAFNNQKYAESAANFTKALEFNSFDTVSTEYLYYNYLYSGRKADAALFNATISQELKSKALRLSENRLDYTISAGSSVSSFSQEAARSTSLYRESLQSAYSIYAALEATFLKRFNGTVAFTSFTKTGRFNSYEYQSGSDFSFTQAQIYGKLAATFFPGWEVSLFGNSAVYITLQSTNETIKEYNAGAGISKNWWKIRTNGNFSISNFSNSLQFREEGYLTWLPQGNLNLYLTTGGMFQYDINWGSSFQADQEIGYRISKNLWCETGVILGNSFLYTRNQGYSMNNSFQIPSDVIYTNIIIPLKKITITLSPYFAQYQNYSWNLSSYTRTNHSTINSFGAAFKLKYNYK